MILEDDFSKIENVKKIAVLRCGALGDFLVTLPALKAIKIAYPQAEIVLLGKPWHKKFLVKGRTPVDRVVVVPLKKGIHEQENETENEDAIQSFFDAMQDEHFDVAINLQGNGVSANPFIKKLNAAFRVGLASENSERLDRDIDFYYYQNETIRYIEVAKLIGAYTSDLEPQIQVLESDNDEIEGVLALLNKKRFVVLQACAVDERRMWPLENYAPLADVLKQQNLEIVFTGSKEDKDAVENVIASMNYPAINACGKMSLGGLTALLSKAALVIGADTGPLHLARAVNTPSVGIYWAPNLINWGPVTRSIHRPVISWEMKCPYCGIVPNDPYPFEPKTDCAHAVSFVRDITVEQVLSAAMSLLNRKQNLEVSDTTKAQRYYWLTNKK